MARMTDEKLHELMARGAAVPVRYTGPANGRVIERDKDNGLTQSYHWRDADGHVLDVAAADLEAILTIPGDEFEVVEPGEKRR